MSTLQSIQASMSFMTERAKPQISAFRLRLAIVLTDSLSPGDDIGNPASMTSTPSLSS
jgi:hypothetical protein